MRRQLNLRRVAVATAVHLRATRKGCSERGGHTCRRHNRSATRLLEADDELRGHNTRSFVQLPLRDEATFNLRALRICALSFAKPKLIGNIGGQIAESRKDKSEFRLKLQRARATGVVVETEADLWR